MGPRADFECKKCQVTYDDLPVASVRCPVCGLKRGFRRLFNRVNVAAEGHAKTLLVDRAALPYQELRQAQHNLREEQRSQRAPVAPQAALKLAQSYAASGVGGGRPELVFGSGFKGPHTRGTYPFPA